MAAAPDPLAVHKAAAARVREAANALNVAINDAATVGVGVKLTVRERGTMGRRNEPYILVEETNVHV